MDRLIARVGDLRGLPFFEALLDRGVFGLQAFANLRHPVFRTPMQIHVAVIIALKWRQSRVGAEALIEKGFANLKWDPVDGTVVIDEIEWPRLIGTIIYMDDAANNMGV